MALIPSVLERVRGNEHPGLQLDKYSNPRSIHNSEDQSGAKTNLLRVAGLRGDQTLLNQTSKVRELAFQTPGTICFRAKTISPLALHLSRATVFENAGCCLHPIHGFAYLPGTGLKGLARSYAETVWLASQTDRTAAWKKIEDVFGWASTKERMKAIKDDSHPAAIRKNSKGSELSSCSGSVVFHDAWPTEWPTLEVDIVNNHHRKYYAGDGPPGDWENPNIVYFLSIKSNQCFEFALSPVRASHSEELLSLSETWLTNGLKTLGIGAKTNAGYGRLVRLEGYDYRAHNSPSISESSHQLELTTPGFFAGATQRAGDCNLRASSIRGHLRWWWRAMLSGFAETETIRGLEGLFWGNTKTGGAISVHVVPQSNSNCQMLQIRDRYNIDRTFASQHGLRSGQRGQTPGLLYASYGMDERNGSRFFMEPGATWKIFLAAKNIAPCEQTKKKSVSSATVLKHAQAALFLLCRYGGVGAKCGKGFGSLNFSNEALDEGIIHAVRSESCELGVNKNFNERLVESASLELATRQGVLEIDTNWNDCWFGLHEFGESYRDLAQSLKHDKRKQGLGLPRKIHGPQRNPMGHQTRDRHSPPLQLRGAGNIDRHISPFRVHFCKGAQGLSVRIIAFPSSKLPDLASHKLFLNHAKSFINEQLIQRKEAAPYNHKAHRQPSMQKSSKNQQPPAKPQKVVSSKNLGPGEPEVLRRLKTINPNDLIGQISNLVEQADNTLNDPKQKRAFYQIAIQKLSPKTLKKKQDKAWCKKLSEWGQL